VLITERAAAWCAGRMKNLEIRKIGSGLHYVQEDHPVEIAEAVRDWRRNVVRTS